MISEKLLKSINQAAEPIYDFFAEYYRGEIAKLAGYINFFSYNEKLTKENKLSTLFNLKKYLKNIKQCARDKLDNNDYISLVNAINKLYIFLWQIAPLGTSTDKQLSGYAIGRSPREESQQIFSHPLDAKQLNEKLQDHWMKQRIERIELSKKLKLRTNPFNDELTLVSFAPQPSLQQELPPLKQERRATFADDQCFWPTLTTNKKQKIRLKTNPFKDETTSENPEVVSVQSSEKNPHDNATDKFIMK